MHKYYFFFLLLINPNLHGQDLPLEVDVQFLGDSTINISYKNNGHEALVIWLQNWRVVAFEKDPSSMAIAHESQMRNEIYLCDEDFQLDELLALAADRRKGIQSLIYPNSMKVLNPKEQFHLQIQLKDFDSKGLLKRTRAELVYYYSIVPLKRINEMIQKKEGKNIFCRDDSLEFSLWGDHIFNTLFSQHQNRGKASNGITIDPSIVLVIDPFFELKKVEFP